MTETSSSILSSNMSFPYSVTSISSRKSRKNVLYPRRVHPPPVTVLPECVGSPDVRSISSRLFVSVFSRTVARPPRTDADLGSSVPLCDLVTTL